VRFKTDPDEKGTESAVKCIRDYTVFPSFKTDPDEKGTESITPPLRYAVISLVSRLIPMKRELKDNFLLSQSLH